MKAFPDEHRAEVPFSADGFVRRWIENITAHATCSIVLDPAGYPKTEWFTPYNRIVGLACPVCHVEKITATGAWVMGLIPAVFPATPSKIRCQACNRSFGIPELVDHFALTRTKKKALLETIGKYKPELCRFIAVEMDGKVAVATAANKALQDVVGLVHNCRARMCRIDAADITIAKQTAGQMHTQLPWRDDVELHRDGTLAQIDWHGGKLSRLEELQLRTQQDRKRFANARVLDMETAQFRAAKARELGL
jgi:hypothetical protein